jgi:methylenetetrahydrofolate dehydrogenase (NADP+) / methenyltetrahydrofolate cyclohydrolase
MGIRIDGKLLAHDILDTLRDEIQTKHLHPHMEVLLVGDNTSSLSYIRQKKRAADYIGATLHVNQLPITTTNAEFHTLLTNYNTDPRVHGIIIQLPLPTESAISDHMVHSVHKQKDIDGFTHNSPYRVPVANAVVTILETIHTKQQNDIHTDYLSWLRNQTIVVVGKGKTAGQPIRTLLESLTIPIVGIDRSTPEPKSILEKASIIISCTGVPTTIQKDSVKENAILISVGLSLQPDGLHGDYEEQDIREKASFYTPTPGGVGPVNVACLMKNLVQAAVDKQQ